MDLATVRSRLREIEAFDNPENPIDYSLKETIHTDSISRRVHKCLQGWMRHPNKNSKRKMFLRELKKLIKRYGDITEVFAFAVPNISWVFIHNDSGCWAWDDKETKFLLEQKAQSELMSKIHRSQSGSIAGLACHDTESRFFLLQTGIVKFIFELFLTHPERADVEFCARVLWFELGGKHTKNRLKEMECWDDMNKMLSTLDLSLHKSVHHKVASFLLYTREQGLYYETPRCSYCKEIDVEENLLRCSACRLAFYCSRECQKSHQEWHKSMCRKIKA